MVNHSHGDYVGPGNIRHGGGGGSASREWYYETVNLCYRQSIYSKLLVV